MKVIIIEIKFYLFENKLVIDKILVELFSLKVDSIHILRFLSFL